MGQYDYYQAKMSPSNWDKKTANMISSCIYMVAFMIVFVGSFFTPDIQWSTLLTLSLFILFIATLNLFVFVVTRQSVAGISLKMIWMQGLSCLLRVAGTSWLNGYVPMDSTGDGPFQVLDALIFCMTAYMYYHGKWGKYRFTYEESNDTFADVPAVYACVIMAVILHPGLNRRPLFDTLWMISLNFDSISASPQVWMMMKNPNQTLAYTSHFVFLLFLSRLMNFFFWYRSSSELHNGAQYRWIGNVVLLTILGSLLVVADFVWYYMKALGKAAMGGEFDMASHFTAIV